MSAQSEYLTVPELAALLRIKERKVYDIAASGQVPVSRATGKLLFPKDAVQAWIDGNRTGPSERRDRPDVLLGSHDPLLEWAVRQSECRLASLLDGSADGVERFCAGEGVVAGLHIYDSGQADWNVPAVAKLAGRQDAVLLSWATRQRGLVMRPEDFEHIQSLTDLKGRTMVARQSASGTSVLWQHLVNDAGMTDTDIDCRTKVRSEQDAALAVAEGQADATFGLEALVKPFGLAFRPLMEERFDLLIDRRAYFEPPFQRLLAFCQTEPFQDRVAATSGYRTDELGQVRWIA